MTRSIMPLLFCAALPVLPLGAASAAGFTDDFASVRPEWRLQSRGKGAAEVREGVLRLDLSSPTSDKQACADLNLGMGLPFTLEWDQMLERDSPHLYWSGVALWRGGDEQPRLMAGLGGAAAGSRWVISGGQGDAIRPGIWYTLRLEVRSDGQTLTVRERDGGRPAVGEAAVRRSLPQGDYYLSFYQNSDRLSAPGGDTYAQDRGVSLVDNVRIAAASLRPGAPPKPVAKPALVFNRATRWLDRRDGLSAGIIAYDATADLFLTGTEGASSWITGEGEPRAEADARSLKVSLPPGGKPARAILRSFQFLLDGHPTLVVDAHPRNAACTLRATITDPYRAYQRVLATVGPLDAEGTARVDLRKLYRERGYDQRYAELDFVLDVAAKDGAAPAEASLSLRLLPEACVVARSPVVVAKGDAGVPIEAICVDAAGALMHGSQVRLTARIGERETALAERGTSGLFTGALRGLTPGIHTGSISALPSGGGAAPAPAPVRIRVHDGRFLDHYSPQARSFCLSGGTPVGPLLGDLYAWTPFVEIGKPGEQMVRGLDEYRRLAEGPKKPLELCKYRPLTRAQVAAYMEYLGRCGVRAIRLTPNVSPAEEYLDAGGKVSPRGLEQLSILLEEASRNGIVALINLFHYPYGSPGTGKYPPVQAYLDAGYGGPADFTREKTLPMLHAYLAQLLSALRQDNAVLGYSLTGENDQAYGAEWINALHRFVRANAPHHLVSLEQGGAIQHVPGRDPLAYAPFEPARSAGLGYRTYYTVGHRSDCYFLVNARLYDRAAPAFLAEVASGPGWYPGAGTTWSHPDFITKVRDNFWTSLLLRQPMAFSWSACLSEDERRIPTEIARAIDWASFRRKRPPVAVRTHAPDNEQLARLMRCEAELAALPLDHDLLWGDAPAEGYAAVLDQRQAFAGAEWGRSLPEALREAQALRLSPGSSATLLEGEDGTLAAYVRNTQEYRLGPGYGEGTQELHRQRQKPRAVRLTVRGRPGRCRYRVWDLDEKRIVTEGTLTRDAEWNLGETAHDFAVLILPGN